MAQRRTLPPRRHVETFELSFGDHREPFKISVGYFEAAAPFTAVAEVFINTGKVGSELEAMARDGAVLLSLALQYGAPLAVIRGALTRGHDGSAGSILGAVVDAQSIIPTTAGAGEVTA